MKYLLLSILAISFFSVTAIGQDKAYLSEDLQGIAFLKSMDDVQAEGVESPYALKTSYEGLFLKNVQPPNLLAFSEIFSSSLGQKVTLEDIEKIIGDVVLFYRENGQPVVNVFVPPQGVKHDIIQVVVIEATLGEIRIEGNEFFATEKIASLFRSVPGETLDSAVVQDDVTLLNKNPYRTIEMVYEEGKEKGTTDVVLTVDDKKPMKYTLAFEDSGNALTEDERVNLGWNWGNAFNRGDVINYGLSADPHGRFLKAHSVSYSTNFPWGHDLSLNGSFAKNGADFPDPSLKIDGLSWGGGINYSMPLPEISSVEGYVQNLVLGYAFSRSNNSLAFGQVQISNTKSDTSEFSLSYSGSLPDKLGMTIVGASLFYSPGGMTSHNSKADLAASGANNNQYERILFNVNRITMLPKNFIWNVGTQFQFASTNLPGGGKFGMGGWMTLPGYDEREANGDEGFLVMTDVTTPPIVVSKYFNQEWEDSLKLRAFFGYGNTSVKQFDSTTINPHITMMSVGPGLRYAVGENLTFRFDYGWQLKDSGGSLLTRRPYNHRGHFSLGLSY